MPSDARIPVDPTLEELSAFLDHELDDATQARVANHVASCAECTRRLDGLRETVYAVRALPMETPARTFTIPEQRRQSVRWAPVGWLGGAAAAMLVIVIGLTQVHLGGPGGAASSTTAGQNYAAAPYAGQVAPLERSNDSATALAGRAASTNSRTVVDPSNSSRSLTISTDSVSYPASGVITIHVTTRGLSSNEAASVRIFLMQGQSGYAVRLGPPSNSPTYPFDWEAAYSISQMHLPAPAAGSYTLQVTLTKSDGQSLTATLAVTITL